jgi:spore coat polysaccharide biosynthesis predicted glycosyltransferase SpsG
LSQALEKRGAMAELIVDGDRSVLPLLSGRPYRMIRWHDDEDLLLKTVRGSDITVVDSYLASLSLCGKIARSTPMPVFFDDNKRITYPSGVVINGAIGAEKMGYLKKSGTSHLLGVQYIPLRKEFWDVGNIKIKRSVKNVLITLGGSGQKNFVSRIKMFLKNRFPQYRYLVAAGGIRAAGIKKLMLRSDIAISAGGQTLYELARVGIPTICIGIVENQQYNIKGWRRAGFIEYAGGIGDSGLFDKLYASFTAFSSHKERAKRSIAGSRLVDGKGACRIVDSLLRNS